MVTGPYYVPKPRYSGKHWQVTVRTGDLIETEGFKAEENAEAYAAEKRGEDG